MKLNRNQLCHCRSGKKYKSCCYPTDRAAENSHLPENRPFTILIEEEIEECCDKALKTINDGNIRLGSKMAHSLMESFPHHHHVQFLMGVYLAVQKKEKEAIPYFEKACEIFPPFAHAYFNLGLAHQRCFNIRGAIENYRTVIRLTHGNGEVGKMAEQAYEKLRVMIENEGLEVDEYLKSEDYFNEAFKLLTQKQFVASVGLFKKVLEIQPNHVQTHGNLGLAYAGLGQKALALEHLDKAMELDPKYEVAIINRIMVEKMEEGRAEAFDSIQEIHYYADYGPGKKSYTKEYMDMLLAQTDKKNSMEQTLEEHR